MKVSKTNKLIAGSFLLTLGLTSSVPYALHAATAIENAQAHMANAIERPGAAMTANTSAITSKEAATNVSIVSKGAQTANQTAITSKDAQAATGIVSKEAPTAVTPTETRIGTLSSAEGKTYAVFNGTNLKTGEVVLRIQGEKESKFITLPPRTGVQVMRNKVMTMTNGVYREVDLAKEMKTIASSTGPQMSNGSSVGPQMTNGSSTGPQMSNGSSVGPQMSTGSSVGPQMSSGSIIKSDSSAMNATVR